MLHLLHIAWVGAPLFIFTLIIFSMCSHFFFRMIMGTHVSEESRLYSSALIGRLGTLHALILALVFSQEMRLYQLSSETMGKMASAISNVYQNLQEYDMENQDETLPIRHLISSVVNGFYKYDQFSLKEGELSDVTWVKYRTVNRSLLSLVAKNNLQKELRQQMINDWHNVSQYRYDIEVAAGNEVPDSFWILAALGFSAVTIPSFVFGSKPTNLLMLSVFAAYNGLVIYFIFALDNPFTESIHIDLKIFNRLHSIIAMTLESHQ